MIAMRISSHYKPAAPGGYSAILKLELGLRVLTSQLTDCSSLKHNQTITPVGVKLFGFSAAMTTMPIAWMHPASESLLIRNPLEKCGELPLFVVRDSSKQRLRVFAGNAAYRLEC